MHIKNTKRTPYDWSNKNILLIDFDNINFRLHKIHFEQTNSTLFCVSNYNEAVYILGKYPINMILMEIRILNDSWEKLLNKAANHFKIPIIIQTSQHDDVLKNLDIHHQGIFQKPLNWDSYMHSINKSLQHVEILTPYTSE